MKRPQRLRLEPRRSRIAAVAVVAGCGAIAILLAALRLPVAATLGCMAIVVAVLASSLRRCAGRGVPAIVHVGLDRTISVTDRDGLSRAGTILDDSYVGSALTTIVWRRDGDPWWRPARTLLVVPDSLTPDEFRRLRVLLRYGRPHDDAGTRGTDAG